MRRVSFLQPVVGLSVAVLSMSSIMSIGLTNVANAATLAWDGEAGDGLFSSATNWSTDTVPTTGDIITFDNSSLVSDVTLSNDISGLSLGGIDFSGSTTYDYTITGDGITLTGDINDSVGGNNLGVDVTLGANVIVNVTGQSLGMYFGTAESPTALDLSSYSLTFSGTGAPCANRLNTSLSGAGDLITDLSQGGVILGQDATAYTGAVTVNGGTLGVDSQDALGSTSGVAVNSGSILSLGLGDSSKTYDFPLALDGAKLRASNATQFCWGFGATGSPIATLTGPVTLNGDATYSGIYDTVISGDYTSNGHSFTVESGSLGSISLPSGAVEAPVEETTIAEDSEEPDTYVSIQNNQTYIIDGIRGDIYLSSGGTLKGTGTVGDVYALASSVVAPGHSPGCLNTGNLMAGGTYQAELGGTTACSEYDQLNVTGTVDLTDGVLDVSFYDGYLPQEGDTYTIINNDGTDAVTGTFTDMAEGATFVVDNAVFKISYVGGDGNDVVLTAQNTPAAPDTGFQLLRTNPALIGAGMIVSLGAVVFMAHRKALKR